MSLESFDKFCEKIIMGEPSSEKEVYDERQNQIRTKLTIEAMWVYIVISAVFALSCETVHWCESVYVLMAFSASVSYLWWVIRNIAKESLFGVKGSTTITTAIVMIVQGIVYILLNFDETDENANFFINNGVVSDNIVIIISLVIMVLTGISVVIASHIRKHKQRADSE